MPWIKEKFGSGQVSDENGDITLTYNFWVFGTKSEAEAYTVLSSSTPAITTFGGNSFRRESIRLEQVANAWDGREAWDGTVTYKKIRREVTIEYQGSTGNTTAHITVSKQVLAKYAPEGETAPDMEGVIGFDDGEIQGADIIVPQPEFSISVEPIDITDPNAFLRTISNMTGKVNANTYLGFRAGELLFSGAEHSGASDKPFRVTYRFQCSPNLYDIEIGGIRVAVKRGWDYLDVLYERTVDTTAKTLIKKPKAIYIHRVYDYIPFAFPGIDL